MLPLLCILLAEVLETTAGVAAAAGRRLALQPELGADAAVGWAAVAGLDDAPSMAAECRPECLLVVLAVRLCA